MDKKLYNNKLLIIGVILGIMLIIMGIPLSMQTGFFFYPNHDEYSYEILKQDTLFEEVKIPLSNGNVISGWLRFNEDKSLQAPLLIFFAGNSENSSSVMNGFKRRDRFGYFGKCNVLVMDYQGYGLSEGKIKNDADFLAPTIEIYDWCINQPFVEKDNIIIMGYSIGTGAATYLASQRSSKGLILIAPYDEALSLYNKNVNIFHGFMTKLTSLKLKSKEYAKNVDEPVLIFASKEDLVISYEFSINLSQYFYNLEDFVTLENVGHSEFFNQDIVWSEIQAFINRNLGDF